MRHTCIICKRKREHKFMENVFGSSWACSMKFHWIGETCNQHSDIQKVRSIRASIRELEVIGFNVNFMPDQKN